VLCGAVFGVPLLLLQNGTSHAPRVATAAAASAHHAHGTVKSPSHLDSVVLPSHLVAYDAGATGAATTTTTAPPVTATTVPVAPPTTTTTVVAHVAPAPAPTTTTVPKPVPAPVVAAPTPTTPHYSENGQATWYAAAPPGKCASPTLPFGTVLTVRNDATGATTTCTVDDREGSPYPRVVDLSYSGFAQIADPSQGVVEVTISW
jgi:rare lipoprotein A (peptidoglycan hydrolase)